MIFRIHCIAIKLRNSVAVLSSYLPEESTLAQSLRATSYGVEELAGLNVLMLEGIDPLQLMGQPSAPASKKMQTVSLFQDLESLLVG